MAAVFFFNDTATTEIYTLSLHDALPICAGRGQRSAPGASRPRPAGPAHRVDAPPARHVAGRGVPGPRHVAEPVAARRTAARRGGRGAPRSAPCPGPGTSRRPAASGTDPESVAPGAPVPPRTVRRHAAARHDRDGPDG